MKRFVVFLFLLNCFSVKAQYFEWSKYYDSGSYTLSRSNGLFSFDVSPQGKTILKYGVNVCPHCWTENIDAILDTNGNFISMVNLFFDDFTDSYFDKYGNLIQVLDENGSYFLKYFDELDTTVTSLSNYQFDYIGADAKKNLYLFEQGGFTNKKVMIYDSSGVFSDSLYVTGDQFYVSDSGFIYAQDINFVSSIAVINKYKNDGTLLMQFNSTYSNNCGAVEFAVSDSSERVFAFFNDEIVCYDTSSNILFAIPVSSSNSISIALDHHDGLYIKEGDHLKKYQQSILMFDYIFKTGWNDKIKLDKNLNIYTVGYFLDPFFDRITSQTYSTSYSIPPSLTYFSLTLDPTQIYNDQRYAYIYKINQSAINDSIQLQITAVNNTNAICAGTDFDVAVLIDKLPLAFANDTIKIELSDSTGNFINPKIIGRSTSLIINCNVDNDVSDGNGYKLRACIHDTIYSLPFNNSFSIRQPPSVSLILDNSVANTFACPPFSFTAHAGPGNSYDWYQVLWPDKFNLGVIDSVLLFNDYFDELIVEVTNAQSGCKAEASMMFPYEVDTTLQYFSFCIPDTLHKNDIPIVIPFSTFYYSDISGNGIYYDSTNVEEPYWFHSDSAIPGWNYVTYHVNYNGTPCIPIEYADSIFVDSTGRNIVLLAVDTIDKTITTGDTLQIDFILLDSSIYDTTNVFVAELGIYNCEDGQLVNTVQLGSSAVSPIIGVIPGYNFNSYMLVQVVSSQHGDRSTFNPNGPLHLILQPNIGNPVGLITQKCFPVNYPITFQGTNGLHEWFLNDSIVFSASGYNLSYTPTVSGVYRFQLSVSGITSVIDSIVVNDSAHIPALTQHPTSAITLCGSTPELLTVSTDTTSLIQWYYGQDSLLTGIENDSLLIFEGGNYSVVVSNTIGCLVSKKAYFTVYENPLIDVDPDLTHVNICNGDSIKLSTYYDNSYLYRWLKNNNQLVGVTNQLTVKDSGNYSVRVISGTCVDTSRVIHVNITSPVAQVTPSGNVISSWGSTVQLSAFFDSSYSYQWYNYNAPIVGATQSVLTTNRYGKYKVEVEDSNGCKQFSNVTRVIFTVGPSPIPPSELRQSESITKESTYIYVYPNPGKDKFTLQGENFPIGSLCLTVSDMYGRTIEKKDFNINEGILLEEIELGEVSGGLYFIRCESPGFSTQIPLVILD